MANLIKINVESAEAVLGLHWFVAQEEGLFEEEGMEVEIFLPGVRETKVDADDPRRTDHRLIKSTNYQFLYEQQKVDIYRACSWGQVRRAYDSERRSPIWTKRPAIVCQGIYVLPNSPANAPMQLAGKSVGVQYHQGSHYHTLSMLEGFLARDEMNVVHAGTVRERFEALENGDVDGATLMEPWIALAEKRGYKKLVEGHYLGVENGPEDMDPDIYKGMLRAIKKSVTYINKNPKKYLKHMLAEIPEHYAKELTADDFYLPRLRYVDPEPYTEEEFERQYKWMLSWDLIPKDAEYGELVCNVTA